MMKPTHCLMCGRRLHHKINGTRQLTCNKFCYRRFVTAAKHCVLAEIEAGRLSLDRLRAAWAGALARRPSLAAIPAPPPRIPKRPARATPPLAAGRAGEPSFARRSGLREGGSPRVSQIENFRL
jgi:hypothetical protein